MGWFRQLKNTLSKNHSGLTYADVMSGRTPIYTAFGRDVYASDVVTQAMSCVTNEMRKLAPIHIVAKDGDFIPVGGGDDIQRILNRPNHYMTTSDFLGAVMYQYFSKCNAWVVPTYREDSVGRRTYTGLYPIRPSNTTFVEDKTGALFVQFRFSADEQPWTIPYSDVIHLRRNYGADEYMGGGPGGLPDDRGLLSTLEINHQMLQGIGKSMKASQAINGIVKYGSIIGKEQTMQAMREWEEKLQNNQSGIVHMDLQGEYIPVGRDLKMVDAETLRFIDEKILRHFGVSLPILTGDYTVEQYAAFYQQSIEDKIIQFSQEFTRVLFTETESESYGHRIQFLTKELKFLTVDQKIGMINLLAPTGAMYENEKRMAFGMHPLPELNGKRFISLNWIEADKATEYQLGDGSQK